MAKINFNHNGSRAGYVIRLNSQEINFLNEIREPTETIPQVLQRLIMWRLFSDTQMRKTRQILLAKI